MTTESLTTLRLKATIKTSPAVDFIDLPKAAIMAFLAKPEGAIEFALGHLQAWEMPEFFQEWRDGKDLWSWIEARHEDLQAA